MLLPLQKNKGNQPQDWPHQQEAERQCAEERPDLRCQERSALPRGPRAAESDEREGEHQERAPGEHAAPESLYWLFLLGRAAFALEQSEAEPVHAGGGVHFGVLLGDEHLARGVAMPCRSDFERTHAATDSGRVDPRRARRKVGGRAVDQQRHVGERPGGVGDFDRYPDFLPPVIFFRHDVDDPRSHQSGERRRQDQQRNRERPARFRLLAQRRPAVARVIVRHSCGRGWHIASCAGSLGGGPARPGWCRGAGGDDIHRVAIRQELELAAAFAAAAGRAGITVGQQD